ncbi:MAG TPA: energy transducer TonB [Acidobacteriaceae bacterium]|jgi:TonB family protein|nr:energy transducer TonB [Acidobacteriaceae bacterium]
MKLAYGTTLVLAMAMALGVPPGRAQQQAAPADQTAAQAPEADQNSLTVEVAGHLFSDDRANLKDYWATLEQRTKDSWLAMMPAEAQPPQSLPGTVRILAVVHTDGSVSNLMLEQRSGKEPLDRAAWAAITRSAPYDAFPSGISTVKVKVRFTFSYNGGTVVTPMVDGVPNKPGM